MIHDSYDVIIIGAGPAGSAAAGRTARAGLRTLLLEKRPLIGIPIRCGEATGNRAELSRFLPLDEAWIESDIHTFIFTGPGGIEIRRSFPDMGVLLRRDKFDQALAAHAAALGAEVLTGAAAVGFLGDAANPQGVKVQYQGQVHNLASSLIIGADGVESMVSRWAGLPLHQTNQGVYSALEYEVTGVPREAGCLKLVFGREYIRNGYLWVFPRDRAGTVKIGAGWLSHSWKPGRTLKNILDDYMAEFHPKAVIIKTVCGSIPLDGPRKEICGNGILLAGDAAHMANPLSAGGIMNALESGDLAGTWAVEAVEKQRFDAGFLKGYIKDINRRIGRLCAIHRRVRGLVLSLEDSSLKILMEAAAPIAPHVTREKMLQPVYYIKGTLKFMRLFPRLAPLLKGMILPKED
jgi:digeranylgeranylglycerophospholipid reductase